MCIFMIPINRIITYDKFCIANNIYWFRKNKFQIINLYFGVIIPHNTNSINIYNISDDNISKFSINNFDELNRNIYQQLWFCQKSRSCKLLNLRVIKFYEIFQKF